MELRQVAAALSSLLGDDTRVLTDRATVEQLSRDFYWYSPVLRKQLDGKAGDLVVQPLTAAEVQKVLRYCYAHDFPVTARGAGTGNYGQAVPLRGGVVLDLARMDKIEEIRPDGVAVCEPGVRLGALENEVAQGGVGTAVLPFDDYQSLARRLSRRRLRRHRFRGPWQSARLPDGARA